jgi:hypothetical protein
MDHLEGGAAGSSATNRKRQEKKQNSSLIDALSGFLQTWQQGQGDTWQNKPRWVRTAPRQTESSMIDDLIQFLHSCKQKQFNDRSVLGCPASTWTGGQWRWTTVRNMHTLVGHIRVSPQIAKTLGRRGIMVTEIGVNTRDEKIDGRRDQKMLRQTNALLPFLLELRNDNKVCDAGPVGGQI